MRKKVIQNKARKKREEIEMVAYIESTKRVEINSHVSTMIMNAPLIL